MTKYWGAQPYGGPQGPEMGGGGGAEPRGPHGVGAYDHQNEEIPYVKPLNSLDKASRND